MKINYTEGRRVNIKLVKSDSSTYFEFINASLTKTGLNDKVRSIGNAGDIISSSTLVGLTSTTRDKIINNLHPEICRIKVPYSGSCNQLFHCDDSGSNCVDRTSNATLLDSVNCIWQISNCEFSTYRESTSSDAGSSSSSGGGGGGGSASLSYASLSGEKTIELGIGGSFGFSLLGNHSIKVENLTETTAKLTIRSEPKTLILTVGETKNVDLNDNGLDDISIKLKSINITAKKVSLIITPLVKDTSISANENNNGSTGSETNPTESGNKINIFIWAVAILIIIIIAVFIGLKLRLRRILSGRRH